jgi:hypothetical protein
MTMHYTEDDLILYYYGEHRRRQRVERHLAACAACAAAYREIAGSLRLVREPDVQERTDQYGLEVWQRIRNRLPEQEAPWWAVWVHPSPGGRGIGQGLAVAGAVVVLVMAAFIAGRSWPGVDRAVPGDEDVVDAGPGDPGNDVGRDAGERVRLAAIGDHLEQSERVLLDFVNAYGTLAEPADVSSQQEGAADLIVANRLYRDASTQAGDEPVAGLLDELERNLLEIVHGPATLSSSELDQIRMRLDAAALLFRVRFLSEELRERELAPITPRKTT